MQPASPPAKLSLKQRFENLVAEYGPSAIALYFGIFFLTWTAFAVAIQRGFEVEGATAGMGTWAAAWVATKLTQPVRIAATFVLTPLVARLLGKRKPETAEANDPATPGNGN